MVSVLLGDAFARVIDQLARARHGAQAIQDWETTPAFAAGKAAVRSQLGG